MPLGFSTQRDPNAGLLPPGVYRFVIEAAEEKQGPKGAYAKLRMRPVVKGHKWSSSVWDNLSTSPDAKFRVDAFMDSVGAANQPGTVGISWFPNKSGWARFDIETGDDGIERPKVVAYLTEDQAEKQLAKLAEKAGTDEDAMTIPTERRTRPIEEDDEPVAPKQTRRTRRQAAAVTELDPDDEDIPF